MGRPPRAVPRDIFHPRLEVEVVRELREQADQVELPLATYMEHVIAEAHGYTGPYLAGLDLPTRISARQLRRRVAALRADRCPTTGNPSSVRGVRLDSPLANMVRDKAAALGVARIAYLAAVLRLAAGSPSSGTSSQLELGIDITSSKGERRLRAS